MDKEIILESLAKAVCEFSGIPFEQLFQKGKSQPYANARGVFYMLAREYGVKLTEIAKYAHRHHSTCLAVARQYKGYYEVRDSDVCNMVDKIKNTVNIKTT